MVRFYSKIKGLRTRRATCVDSSPSLGPKTGEDNVPDQKEPARESEFSSAPCCVSTLSVAWMSSKYTGKDNPLCSIY